MENEKAPEIFMNTLHTDLYPSFIDPMCESLSYYYLGPSIEEIVEEIPSMVFQEIKRLPKSENNLLEKKKEALNSLSPEKTNINTYYETLKETYNAKIQNQKDISNLGKDYQKDIISFSYLCEEGEVLIKKGLDLEPIFFAITELAKQQVDTEIKSIIKKYENCLSNEEVFLLHTPLTTDFFTKRFLDIQNFLENPSIEKENLLQIRYGRYIFNKKWFKQQKLDIIQKRKIEQREKQNFCKKYYFLLERKIPNSQEIDYILTMDHIVDKHIQANVSFLHDVFLKMQILNGEEKIPKIKDKNEIKLLASESIKELLKSY